MTTTTTTIDRKIEAGEFQFYVLVDGTKYPLHQDVRREHSEVVHDALGTSSEMELQRYLENCYAYDWFRAGEYLGEDDDGLGIELVD